MLNVAKFKEAKEVWRDNGDVLERGRRFKLKELQEFGSWTSTRRYKLTYWTKADEWTGAAVCIDGKKKRMTRRECEDTARRFEIIV